MKSADSKFGNCLEYIVILAIIIYTLNKIGCIESSSDTSNAELPKKESVEVDYSKLEITRDSLANIIEGVYEGAFYSNVNIPAAGIRPGYINYSVEIYSLTVDAKVRNIKTQKVDSIAAPHYWAHARVFGVDAEAYAASQDGMFVYFPEENRICFVMPDLKNIFGDDPCNFSFYKRNIVNDNGEVLIKRAKKNIE
jgi:hypothetical protein